MRFTVLGVLVMTAQPLSAETVDLGAIVNQHILPGYTELAAETAEMARIAADDCAPSNDSLREAYHDAFDAWIRVSHLRFGPSEVDDRAFGLAFWPDPRGSTPKTLATLLRDEDPVVNDPDAFATVSVAARGFYAMEFLLFDTQFTEAENRAYHCGLVQAVSTNIAGSSAAILSDWESGYGDLLANPGNDTYRSEAEAAQQVFTAISTGLEFTSDARLGRPLGTFERPRPNRAEARRSERSLRHVALSVEAVGALAALLTDGDERVTAAFDTALGAANDLEDPVFAGVATPDGRVRVEGLRQRIDEVRVLLAQEVGPRLGISAGFNSLDGD